MTLWNLDLDLQILISLICRLYMKSFKSGVVVETRSVKSVGKVPDCSLKTSCR